MNFTKKIISVIQEAQAQETKLNLEDTISVIKAVTNVSENKNLLEKTLQLILIVEQKVDTSQKLTIRESQIFNLIGLGFNSKEIAEVLSISHDTVSTHRKNIIKKLSLKGAGKLQKAAFQHTNEKLKK
ncbi:hypothetical protein G5B37_13600 [Rasiella rasia]|uniref:HTH luxR-type domain-containing protein n=1 Tax=Rasiella rasia TaxID=2744027 RepID=A0A6G6GPT6_9FLAO|nr:LuxR C-terminal-related transcriptional regulator [Rasiella rasia]QIE60562.1 hypothetical protein G5B37_13600 [Rasiella rasia]